MKAIHTALHLEFLRPWWMITKSNETRRVDQKSTGPTRSSIFSIVETFLPSATKLRRLCFYRHLSVHRGEGVSASVHGGIPHPPIADTPLGADTPPEQTPPGADTPPGAGTPSEADTPRSRPPRSRHTPTEQTPSEADPPGADTPQEQTPPQSRHPHQIRPLLRTVRILLEFILVCFVMVRWGESKCVNCKTSASQRHYETFWGRG